MSPFSKNHSARTSKFVIGEVMRCGLPMTRASVSGSMYVAFATSRRSGRATVSLAPNLASTSAGASIVSASSQDDGSPAAAASPSTTHLPEARPEGKAAPEAPQQPAEGAKVVALETFRKK